MKWSTRIGTFAGIDVYVHTTFLILVAWVALAHWQTGHSAAAALEGVAFILALFGCVVLHEFGPALTARRFGIKTRDITLLPIGGLARLERMPDDPRQELWAALAGPAVNVVIAAALFVLLQASGAVTPLSALSVTSGSFLERLMASCTCRETGWIETISSGPRDSSVWRISCGVRWEGGVAARDPGVRARGAARLTPTSLHRRGSFPEAQGDNEGGRT